MFQNCVVSTNSRRTVASASLNVRQWFRIPACGYAARMREWRRDRWPTTWMQREQAKKSGRGTRDGGVGPACRWVSTPRCRRTSAKVTSMDQRRTNQRQGCRPGRHRDRCSRKACGLNAPARREPALADRHRAGRGGTRWRCRKQGLQQPCAAAIPAGHGDACHRRRESARRRRGWADACRDAWAAVGPARRGRRVEQAASSRSRVIMPMRCRAASSSSMAA